MSSATKSFERLVSRIEQAKGLDAPSVAVAGVLSRLLGGPRTRTLLSGTPLGHPLHPVLVSIPIGAWTGASLLDLAGGRSSRRSAEALLLTGCVAAAPTALAGWSDWLSTADAERRVGSVHASLNILALSLYTGSLVARRRGNHRRGVALALVGGGLISAAGWLGGHLTYARGVGVDTTAFQVVPSDWVDLIPEAELSADRPTPASIAGVAVLVVALSGGLSVIEARCTHRGGPLHEGKVRDGHVVCPWHASIFDLRDGSVVCGPAVRPQRRLDVRTVDGMVQVRRGDDPGSLRANPVGG